ncbi:hypothetical protein FRC11_012281, partial [Ceratobasidium sp. 423]
HSTDTIGSSSASFPLLDTKNPTIGPDSPNERIASSPFPKPPNWLHSSARGPIEPRIVRPPFPPVGLGGLKTPSDNGEALSGCQTSTFRPHFSSAYALGPDPSRWGVKSVINNEPEPDDNLHNPDPARDRKLDRHVSLSMRGLSNVGCLVILLAAIILLFAGYPIISYLTKPPVSTLGAYNLGGINASGQVPEIPGFRADYPNAGLIDRDTPKSAYTRTSHVDGRTYDLVFSDEFNVEGRSFYPGDDPYWEAVDLHYCTCDVGTLANQTDPVTNLPAAAHVGGPPGTNGEMSYLGGQRLSACTCTSESDGSDGRQIVHPGPKRADGSYVGRGAPEIDIFEATVDANTLIGHVSQSGQWAPFNAAFRWDNETGLVIYDHEKSHLNTFIGNERQQTTSVLTNTNQQCYIGTGGCFQTYGVEYKTGEDGYIQWVTDDSPVFMVKAAGLGPDPLMQIGPRPIPVEPMYILLNLGMSYNFGGIDLENLVFPTYMLVDYVRVYQPSGKWNIGCDPKDYPTADYINTYIEAYTNPNLTTWVDDYKQRVPKNRLID